jgi:hypothetical protein
VRRFRDSFTKQKVRLSYFDEVLAVELGAINARRAKIGVEAVKKLEPKSSDDNRPTCFRPCGVIRPSRIRRATRGQRQSRRRRLPESRKARLQ